MKLPEVTEEELRQIEEQEKAQNSGKGYFRRMADSFKSNNIADEEEIKEIDDITNVNDIAEVVESNDEMKIVNPTKEEIIDADFREVSEISDDEEIDDIPEVEDKKNKSFFSRFKKNENTEAKEEAEMVTDMDDIPAVQEKKKKSLFSKLKKNKNKVVEVDNKVEVIEENASDVLEDIPDVVEKKKVSLSDRLKSFKEKRSSKSNKVNSKYIKTFVSCIFMGGLTCVAIAGALIASTSVATIGLLPAMLITTLFVSGTALSHFVFKVQIEELEKIHLDSIVKEENNSNEVVKTNGKRKLFSKVKGSFNKLISKKKEENVIEEQQVEEKVDTSNEVVSETAEEKIVKTKLTREQKIGKLQECGKLGQVKGLGIYCLTLPKEEKQLEKFARKEYKKEYPKEKIQSFETENEKVLVLHNKPTMFR